MEQETNGRLSNAQLYKGLLEIYTQIDSRLTAHEELVGARINCLDERVNAHIKDGGQHGSSTAKSGGIAGAVAAIVVALGVLFDQVIRR